MGQEFHVVRCFSCQSFQVQQVKKVNKWSCKLCGKKQTLLKEFGRGSGADCRRHVQKLNAMRGAVIEEQEHNTRSLWEQAEEEEEEEEEPEEEQQVSQAQGSQAQGSQAQVSRWIKYLDAPEEAEPEEEDEEKFLLDRKQLHANRMTDGKRKRGGWTHTSTTEQDPPSMTRTYKATQPSQNQTSPNQSSPPSKRRLTPPSSGSGPGSRWACFLRSDREVKEGEETSGSGRSRSEGGTAFSLGTDVIPTVARPRVRPLLPVSSMFESGEEFIFDDSLSSSNF
ncbi:MRN complex-interacting protein isoform X2 [Labrus mixtus]|uniref:MRN complex-interacting protein isoform X2 n=1 Tax=Labrus mixtus TaxID=508554 RepID=UPI0029C0D296|nr:MRN complex-interacting protein isoform X2 [Labrus mixtus]